MNEMVSMVHLYNHKLVLIYSLVGLLISYYSISISKHTDNTCIHDIVTVKSMSSGNQGECL